jgi:homoserine O-succinyltransferase/O-acetyltransferase
MPLTIDKGPTQNHRAAQNGSLKLPMSSSRSSGCIRVALVNNMPDAALEDTEAQFSRLLADACGKLPVHLSLYSLPGVPRGERGKQYLQSSYRSADELRNNHVDAVIITGTEPRQADLREEPYWSALATLLDWAEANTESAILSCLAAHASVLHSDGIARRKLTDKRFGLFGQRLVADHSLIRGVVEPVRFPHSRWNDLPEQELASCGYLVLTQSAEAGVDSFVKKKKRSLFVHFQGHPEYGAQTLLKEYRRDIGRFLRGEREAYPSMPHGYFDPTSLKLLTEFQANAISHRHEDLLAAFPQAIIGGALHHSWRNTAICIYRNWLHYVAATKVAARKIPVAVKAAQVTRTYTRASAAASRVG